MEIALSRKLSNPLYTEGELAINDDLFTHTVESSESMLPAGTYTLRIVKHSERRQSLAIFRPDGTSTGWSLGIGSSFINSRNERMICIGNRLIPGALYRASHDYGRLVDRFSKCVSRGETMDFVISERNCRPNQPIHHWLRALALVIVSVLVMILSSCSSYRKVAVAEHSVHDTLYVNTIQYDSVFIDQWQYRDRSSDTVFLEKVRLEYKYKFLKDTVRIIKVDSIPVIHEVEVTKTVKTVPSLYKACLWFSVIVIVIVIVYIAFRVFRAFRVQN